MQLKVRKMNAFNGFRNEKKPTGSNIESAGHVTPSNCGCPLRVLPWKGGDQTNLSNNVLSSGYVTIPRTRMSDNVLTNVSRTSSSGTTVTMRRSASVPCKRDRDSTSSGGSDSGVSTGSPRQSITEQMEFIK